MSSRYYILDSQKNVIPCTDVEEMPGYLAWARWFEDSTRDGSRIVAQHSVGEIRVSTVFLGLDHRWGPGPPLIFETTVFGGHFDDSQWRCSTWAQAEEQHARALAAVRLSQKLPGRKDLSAN